MMAERQGPVAAGPSGWREPLPWNHGPAAGRCRRLLLGKYVIEPSYGSDGSGSGAGAGAEADPQARAEAQAIGGDGDED